MWSKAEEEWGQTSDMFRPGSEEQEEPVTREQTDTIGKISHYRLIRQRGNQLISKRLPSESTFNFDKYN